MEHKREDIELTVTQDSDPYWIMQREVTCSERWMFYLARYPPMALAFLYSMCKSLLILAQYAFCCRSTYYVPTDEEVDTIFNDQWPFSDIIKPIAKDAHSPNSDIEYGVFDASIMNEVAQHAFPGLYGEGMIARFSRRINHETGARSRWHIDHVTVNGNERVDSTKSKPVWDLTKLYLMQNAHYLIKFSRHGYIHFPQEAFFAITQHYFPNRRHLFQQLLAPHMEFATFVNHGVLSSPNSVLNSGNGTSCCWDAQMTDRVHIQPLLREGAKRLPPLYGKSPSVALQPFYQVIYRLVHCVVQQWIESANAYEKVQVQRWKQSLNDYLNYNINTDWNEENIAEEVKLISTILSDVIFKVSVWHSSEHYGFTRPILDLQPMRIRKPYDTDEKEPLPTGWASHQVVSVWERIKQEIYCHMFVCWWNNRLWYNTRLDHTTYDFESSNPHLALAADLFRRQLRLVASMQHVVPIDRISKAIEW